MPNDSRRTVLVSLGAGLGVALAKAGAAAFTGSRHGRRGVAFTRRYHQRPVPIRGSASQHPPSRRSAPLGVRAGGRDSDYAAHIGDRADERQALIRTRAQAQAGEHKHVRRTQPPRPQRHRPRPPQSST